MTPVHQTYYNPLFHSPASPFCSDIACLCHSDSHYHQQLCDVLSSKPTAELLVEAERFFGVSSAIAAEARQRMAQAPLISACAFSLLK
jgi:hypothetical protein